MLTHKEYTKALNPGHTKWKDLSISDRQVIQMAINVQCFCEPQLRWVDESTIPYCRYYSRDGVYRIKPDGTDQYIKSTNHDPEIKVTKIKNRWHARLIHEGKVKDELACERTEDIGLICKEMLRWFDKMGNLSQYADKARHRTSTIRLPKGKIWYRPMLEAEKMKRLEAHG